MPQAAAIRRHEGAYLRLNPAARAGLRHIGTEAQPLLIVDDVLAEPEAMIDAAAEANFYVPPHTNYPGINANLPESYYLTIIGALRPALEAAFGLSPRLPLNYFGFFGLATKAAAEATPAQKAPHVDCYDPRRLALVHYFCDARYDGTGFFKQRATGFESVDQGRAQRYVDTVMAERAQPDPDAVFPGESAAHYDLIGKAEMAFNRLIVYRSHVLHTPLLAPEGASADPRLGRLTANGFITPAGAAPERRPNIDGADSVSE